MKILETKPAPNPRRVRIFLAEKGITVPFEQLDIMKKEAQTEEFRRLNPFQQVPVLMLDDGTALSETVAICRYFEEMQPEPALFGRGTLGRAVVEMWNRRMEFGLLFRVAQVFRHGHPAMAPLEVPQVAAWADANRPKVGELLGLLDAQLAANRFVAGPDYTIADITAMVAIDFMRPARLERPASLVNLARWYGEASARPSAKA